MIGFGTDYLMEESDLLMVMVSVNWQWHGLFNVQFGFMDGDG